MNGEIHNASNGLIKVEFAQRHSAGANVLGSGRVLAHAAENHRHVERQPDGKNGHCNDNNDERGHTKHIGRDAVSKAVERSDGDSDSPRSRESTLRTRRRNQAGRRRLRVDRGVVETRNLYVLFDGQCGGSA